MSYATWASKPVSNAYAADSIGERSTMFMKWDHKTTFNFGNLIPIADFEILPGDLIHSIDVGIFARLSTLLFPVMDNARLDFWAFFVPWRLVWEHTAQFFGENNVNAWELTTEYQIPTMPAPISESDAPFTYVDYFGLAGTDTVPAATDAIVNALRPRSLRLIWNEWFRNENVDAPKLVNTGDTETDYTLWDLLPVCRVHDVFSDCLPAPQKGPTVKIPGFADDVPVTTSATRGVSEFNNQPMMWISNATLGSAGQQVPILGQVTGLTSNLASSYAGSATTGAASRYMAPANLWAQTSEITEATIANLRTAFQIQRIYERDARGGTRYTEFLQAAFHVKNPDARLQRPEFLGMHSVPINISQVVQNSSTTADSALGDVAAYSKTAGSWRISRKAFTEFGYFFILCAARTDRTYQGIVPRDWTKKSRFEFFDPALAHVSNQPVYVRELFSDVVANNDPTGGVFGYQEAWYEYRNITNRVSGAFRSSYAQSLDAWHWADDYSSAPTLSPTWMHEDYTRVNRSLAKAASGQQHDQVLADFAFRMKISRPVPLHSIPGLVDHF